MKGDFTRVTFDPERHFSRVLMQQGRVQLDADFNEQAEIFLHYLRTLAADLIGPYGGPGGAEANFEIYAESVSPPSGPYHIGVGHYYVDGILAENHNSEAIIDPPHGANKDYYVYLDVWERHITRVQDPSIQEVALGAGGPDTCTRAKVVWRVRHQELNEEIKKNTSYTADCDGVRHWVQTYLRKPALRSMRARVDDQEQSTDACSIPPKSAYRGLENHLYRIEVHNGGEPWDSGTKLSKSGTLSASKDAATIKWSRDNGSVVFPIVSQKGKVVFVEHLGRDQRTGLRVDDWVEIIDDEKELAGEAGILAQVDNIDTEKMKVTLKEDDGTKWPDYNEQSESHPLLRRWDQRKIVGQAMNRGAILIPSGAEEIEIEDGIKVSFQLPDGGSFRTGDYWLIPARGATGDIEWPKGGNSSKALPPEGIEHHYAPLAVICADGTVLSCRDVFNPCCTVPE